jgi:transposase
MLPEGRGLSKKLVLGDFQGVLHNGIRRHDSSTQGSATMPANSALPDNLADCHSVIIEQRDVIAQQDRLIHSLRRELYGSRSERFVEGENGTLESDESGGAGAASAPPPEPQLSPPPSLPKRTSKGRRPRVIPDNVPRVRREHRLNEDDIPEHLRNHPRAKRFFRLVREELEVQPATLRVIEHYQEVIVLEEETGDTSVRAATVPPPLLKNCYAHVSLLSYLVDSRFAFHLTYYRLEELLARNSHWLHRSTQWRWMRGLADLARPLVARMRELTLQSHVLGFDETPIPLYRPESHRTKSGYLWAGHGDAAHPLTCFFFTPTREQRGPREFLKSFRGYLQSDAYICYELITDEAADRMVAVGCWAHARRKYEALDDLAPHPQAQHALSLIQRLYDIEDRGRGMTDAERLALRQAEAKPIVDEFKGWLDERDQEETPRSPLREAINYQLKRWKVFVRYLEDGAIPIDNNRTEAAIRGPKVGKKNWLYFGNERSGDTAAILYTLTTTCRRHSIDVYTYLVDVLPRLANGPPQQLDELLPHRWIESHPEARVQERVEESYATARRKRVRRAERRLAKTAA